MCKNLGFRRDNKVILDNITQEFKRGYVYGISGENWCRKEYFYRYPNGIVSKFIYRRNFI